MHVKLRLIGVTNQTNVTRHFLSNYLEDHVDLVDQLSPVNQPLHPLLACHLFLIYQACLVDPENPIVPVIQIRLSEKETYIIDNIRFRLHQSITHLFRHVNLVLLEHQVILAFLDCLLDLQDQLVNDMERIRERMWQLAALYHHWVAHANIEIALAGKVIHLRDLYPFLADALHLLKEI